MRGAIITGANGFLGSALAQCLAEQDLDVYAIVREKSALRNCLRHPKIHIVYCDQKDISTLEKRIPKYGADIFYHFAWAGTAGSGRADYSLQLDNVRYCCDAVLVARKLDCRKFIFAGSIMEYEAMQYIPGVKSTVGLSYVYSTAKLAAHFMAKAWADKSGIEFVAAIISNVYGVGETSNRFINATISNYLKNQPVSFTAGEQLYDFIYVTDAVEAFCLIGKEDSAMGSYYIGNTVPRPLKEFIEEIHKCVNPTFPLVLGEVPFNGPLLTYKEFDTKTLNRQFGFEPKIAFHEGIKLLLEWMKTLEADA